MSRLNLIKEYFSRTLGFDSLGSLENSYLTKYFLSDDEYRKKWQSYQSKVFRTSINFPSEIFNEEFQTDNLLGGSIFSESEFVALKNCLKITRDNSLLIIEDSISSDESPIIRLKFPCDICWAELVDGGDVSFDIFERPIRNYFVFGDSLTWGKYVGSDFEQPIDIIGYTKQYAEIFEKSFASFIIDKVDNN